MRNNYRILMCLYLFPLFGFAQNHINTNAGIDPFYISRNIGITEAFKISVDDRIGLFEYYQDESDGTHDLIFNIVSAANHYYRWRSNNSDLMLLNRNGNLFLNSNDPDNAGLRILFDKTTNNNGTDVDLIINSNSGSPIVDWYIKNWGGSYVFNRGANDGSGGTIRKELFKIDKNSNISVPGGTIYGANSQSIKIGYSNKVLYLQTDIESPSWRDQVAINSNASSGYGLAFSGQGHHRGGIYAENIGGSASSKGNITIWARNGGNIILDGGKIGIGTTTPDYKLAVNGTIGAKEVKVTSTGWPDFVFESDYNLPTLQEVETFINQNGHLPDIPSAEEVEDNGISLGEMNAKLLQKIEELTLYTLKQQKEIETSNKKFEAQGKEIEELKAMLKILMQDKD